MAKKRKEKRYLVNLVKGLPNTEEVHQMVKSINKLMQKSESKYKLRIVYRGPTYAYGETRRQEATSISLYLVLRPAAKKELQALHQELYQVPRWRLRRQLFEDMKSKIENRMSQPS